MALTKHTIWEVFLGAETLENFKKNFAPAIFLKNELPELIKNTAITSEKLLLHSYYEYDFIDVALTHTIFNFEKALRLRWAEIHGAETKKNLYKLIDWFYNNKYFETLNDGLPHQLRHIRNGKVHDTSESVGGVVFIDKVYETYYLINDLYEDPQLRILRTDLRHSLNQQLSEFTNKGTIISLDGQKLIVFCAVPVFVDNKSLIHQMAIFICPIF